jgi:hypothetical protein
VLIGGFAMIAHGAGRFTKDDAPENVARIRGALAILADNAAADVADLDVRTHTVVRVVDEVVIDLMGLACGLSYTEVVADAETVTIGDVPVTVASPAMLIKTKNTYRPQDAIDRSFLEALLRGRPDAS